MKYTAEEVRARFEAAFGKCPEAQLTRNGDGYLFIATDHRWDGWQAAYAERIEADERLVPRFMTAQDEDMGGWLAASLDDPAVCTEMKLCVSRWMDQFTHPPAQATQVDPAAKLRTLADFVNAPDAERARTGQQVAARVDEMMAEPVAQGEVVQQEEYGGPDFEERCETLAKIERDMRIYLDEGMLLTPYTLELLCNRIKSVRDAGHDNVVMSLYNFRTLRRLAAQRRAVPDGDDALCKLAEKYGDEGGRPA